MSTDCCEINVTVSETEVIAVTIPIGPPGPRFGRVIKGGVVQGSSFSGSPQKFTVTFETAFDDTNYLIQLSGEDARIFTYESKTVDGFIINSNAGSSFTGEVSWFATVTGEST